MQHMKRQVRDTGGLCPCPRRTWAVRSSGLPGGATTCSMNTNGAPLRSTRRASSSTAGTEFTEHST